MRDLADDEHPPYSVLLSAFFSRELREATNRQEAVEAIRRIVSSDQLGPFHPLPWHLGRLWVNARVAAAA